MAIPDYQSLMRPVLALLADGQTKSLRDMVATLATEFSLSAEEFDQLLPSGQQSVFHNRVSWARTYLKAAGLIENPQRGHARITPDGIRLLTEHRGPIDARVLEKFESFREFRKKTARTDRSNESESNTTNTVTLSPEENLDFAYDQIRARVEGELLSKLKSCSPSFFEKIVVELLMKMGYGGKLGHGRVTPLSGDGGIDGVINQDKLGLDVVCIQAKRWETTVGRPVVQAFVGSMDYYRGRKGVIITTSSFSKDAEDYVGRIEGKKVVLIDGEELAELMIDHNLGVFVKRTYEVKELSNDFFEEE
ncbi:restriction endonuclease [bacterium]|nr:restriction endonuclease [bacterium]